MTVHGNTVLSKSITTYTWWSVFSEINQNTQFMVMNCTDAVLAKSITTNTRWSVFSEINQNAQFMVMNCTDAVLAKSITSYTTYTRWSVFSEINQNTQFMVMNWCGSGQINQNIHQVISFLCSQLKHSTFNFKAVYLTWTAKSTRRYCQPTTLELLIVLKSQLVKGSG